MKLEFKKTCERERERKKEKENTKNETLTAPPSREVLPCEFLFGDLLLLSLVCVDFISLLSITLKQDKTL
jgi:hypothetical protein